jgi:hypothetical protein
MEFPFQTSPISCTQTSEHTQTKRRTHVLLSFDDLQSSTATATATAQRATASAGLDILSCCAGHTDVAVKLQCNFEAFYQFLKVLARLRRNFRCDIEADVKLNRLSQD